MNVPSADFITKLQINLFTRIISKKNNSLQGIPIYVENMALKDSIL